MALLGSSGFREGFTPASNLAPMSPCLMPHAPCPVPRAPFAIGFFCFFSIFFFFFGDRKTDDGFGFIHTHTHKHTHGDIYIYVYIFCAFGCVWFGFWFGALLVAAASRISQLPERRSKVNKYPPIVLLLLRFQISDFRFPNDPSDISIDKPKPNHPAHK